MRHRWRFTLALMSCCWLFFFTGCKPEATSDNYQDDSQDAQNAHQAPSSPKLPQNPPAPPSGLPPVVVAPAVGPVGGGGGGGGGGSQGGERPADTGNPDNDPNHLPETICDDGIDNDNDGKIDCADSNCVNKPCNDGNGCTLNDVCVGDTCQGDNVDCDAIVSNECTVNMCESISSNKGNNNFKCNSMLDTSKNDYGDCTPTNNCDNARNSDGLCLKEIDECIVGRCIQASITSFGGGVVNFFCEEKNKIDLTVGEGGCKDGNSCHAYRCEDGVCEYSLLHKVPCDDGNLCTTMDTCNMGTCEPGMNVPSQCFSDAECAKGSTCVGLTQGSCENSDDACLSDLDCPINTCTLVDPGTSHCFLSPSEDCTSSSCTENACIENLCLLTFETCTVNTDCPENTCVPDEPSGTCALGDLSCTSDAGCTNACEAVNPGVCSCNDENDCTLDDQCNGNGSCVKGSDGPQPCTTGADCESGSCVQNLCACSDGNDCTISDSCNNAVCQGQTVPSTCTVDGDCGTGKTCITTTQGTCSGGTNNGNACSVNADCPGGSCTGAVRACSCIDGISCTVNTCDGTECVVSDLDDDVCSISDDPCSVPQCTNDGCKYTLMDGPMICGLLLSDLSQALADIISNANLSVLTCDIGRLQCSDGVSQGVCTLDQSFPATCSEAVLESKCTIMSLPQDISPEVAQAICDELAKLANPG